jgi:hypothetical protein
MQLVGSETYDRRLNLPMGVLLTGEQTVGKFKLLSFRFYDSVTGRRSVPEIIPYLPNQRNGGSIYSANAIETMIGEAHETWLTQVRAQGKMKPKMTVQERKDAGKVLNEIRTSKLKRTESSTGKIYFGGTKIDRRKLNRKFKRKARANRR